MAKHMKQIDRLLAQLDKNDYRLYNAVLPGIYSILAADSNHKTTVTSTHILVNLKDYSNAALHYVWEWLSDSPEFRPPSHFISKLKEYNKNILNVGSCACASKCDLC